MGRRSLRPYLCFSQACNVDANAAMSAGQTEKPARFWRVGTRSPIPLQLTDHAAFASRYEGRGMGSRSLRPPLFFAGMQCTSKCYGGWPNGETCVVLEGWERVL